MLDRTVTCLDHKYQPADNATNGSRGAEVEEFATRFAETLWPQG